MCVHQTILEKYYLSIDQPKKLNFMQAYAAYRKHCEAVELTPLSYSSMRLYAQRNRWWMSKERHGEAVHNEKWVPYIKLERPKYEGSLWVADWSGTKLRYLSDKGQVLSLYMLRIYDDATGKLMGYDLTEGLGESPEAVLRAVRMAIRQNEGYSAVELLTDNSPAWRHKSVRKHLKRLFLRHSYIGIGNKQANPAERWIQTQSQLARKQNNFQYLGFASHFKNAEMRSNPDAFVKEKLPTRAQDYAQVEELNKTWNSGRPTATRHPRFSKPTEQDLRYAFGHHSEVSLAHTRGVLLLHKKLEKYYFDVNNWSEVLDWAARVCTDRHLTIFAAWDEAKADLYAPDGAYYCSCLPVQKSSRFAEHTEETKAGRKQQRAKKKRFKDAASRQLDELRSRHLLVPQEDYHILAKEDKVKPSDEDEEPDINITKLARSQY